MTGGIIEGNRATGGGGGLFAQNASVALNSGKIRDNTVTSTSTGQGGGVWFNTGSLGTTTLTLGSGIEISGNTISASSSGVSGGGIFYLDSSTITTAGLTIPAGARITGNRAINTGSSVDVRGGGIHFDGNGEILHIVNGSSITGNVIADNVGASSPYLLGNGIYFVNPGSSITGDRAGVLGNLRGQWGGTTITGTTDIATEQIQP
jgi:hypothetical protein